MEKAVYHLPGLFEFYDFYRKFLPIYREKTEYFYDWCQIGSLYGAPADCLWAGGRVSTGNANPRQVLALTEEYGLQAAAAFPGCSSESEPSVKTMAFLIDTVRAENIPYVFTVERSNRSIADTVAAETGAGVLEMHSCHTLSAAERARGESYLSLMYKNLENLKRGLQYAAN